MILKKIHIHNIASLENAELDFDQKPLSTARLFLICGDTGSGKTPC
ncbi:MAG: AAA family ATPase [Bacteroidales bacterium]|nr:AAA family ATPase [Bacteroidales bacterium]